MPCLERLTPSRSTYIDGGDADRPSRVSTTAGTSSASWIKEKVETLSTFIFKPEINAVNSDPPACLSALPL